MKSDIQKNKRATIIGIAGCTNAGKTTLAQNLYQNLIKRMCLVKIFSQDDYFKEINDIIKVQSILDHNIFFYDYDKIESINVKKFVEELDKSANFYDFIIVEGNMITDMPEIFEFLSCTIFLTINKKLCLKRRAKRIYEPPDKPGYFEQIVWPSYTKTLKNSKKLKRLKYYDIFNSQPTVDDIYNMTENYLSTLIRIQIDPINIENTIEFAKDNGCGAISTFIGTTRNIFEEKKVKKLEYESYDKMVYSELRKTCMKIRKKYSTLKNVIIIHRIGEVKVGEASIIIALSSPQRKDALNATENILESVKKFAPIWKKEIYEDNSYSWKENEESIKPIF